jgi:hypothetical protein
VNSVVVPTMMTTVATTAIERVCRSFCITTV